MKDICEVAASSDMTPMVRRLSIEGRFSNEDVSELERLQRNRLKLKKGAEFIREGKPVPNIYVPVDGWVMQYSLTLEGRRQIHGLAMPGDPIGLHSSAMAVASASARCLTDVELAVIDPEEFFLAQRRSNRVARAVQRAVAEGVTIQRGHAVRLGRLTAEQRIAHFLCEIWHRHRPLGVSEGEMIRLPLTQSEISDHLGLSLVHTNRQLQILRREGLIETRRERVALLDLARLEALGDFRPEFLT